ncbi:MAG: sulfatase-like hydrolase/transferase, partial [Candidatus Binatia bacterium]
IALGLVLVAAKATYLLAQAPTKPQGAHGFLGALSAITVADVGFVAAVGVGHWLLLLAAHVVPGLRACLKPFLAATYSLAAAFAIANLSIFAFFRMPLTHALVSLAGDASGFFSILSASLTLPVLGGLLGGVWIWAGTLFALRLLVEATPGGTRRDSFAVLVVLAALWCAWGGYELETRWQKRADHRIAENPHVTYLASVLRAPIDESPLALSAPVAEIDLEDFDTVAVRSERSAKAPIVRAAAYRTTRAAAARRPKNVILVVLESVAARWLEPYGSPYPATPILAAEAKNSLVFDAFYAPAGRSSDSLAALLLSVHPRVSWRDVTVDFPDLPGESIAARFRENGRRTALFTASDLGWANWRGFVRERGFDVIREHRDLRCGPLLTYWGGEDRCAMDGLLGWLEEDSEQPFFAMVWTVQTHHPYEPTPGAPLLDFFHGASPADAYDLDRYLNVLHDTDRQLGRLFAALRASGRDRDTLVVIVGDHGEAFGDPRSIYGHGTTLYDEQMRVPMMLWSPKLFPRGSRSAVVGGHVDLPLTIADLVGIEPAPTWQGRSLLSADPPWRTYFTSTADGLRLGIREARWKYILDATTGKEELYDIGTDPEERTNVASSHLEITRRLRERVAARLEADRRFYSPLIATGAPQPG